MNQMQIAVVVGSIRRDSFNKQLAGALKKMASQEFTFKDLRIDDLPLYNQDLDGNQPEQVGRLKSEISSCAGVIFVTPEYNRSIPGVLKNAIDHGSRPYGESAWMGKPAGVIGISPGAAGTCMAQQHLRNILAYLDMPTMGQPEVFLQMKDGLFDSNGDIADSRTRQFVQRWVDRYVSWVKSFARA